MKPSRFFSLLAGGMLALPAPLSALSTDVRPTLAVARVETAAIADSAEAQTVSQNVRSRLLSDLGLGRRVIVKESLPTEEGLVGGQAVDYLLKVSVTRYTITTNAARSEGIKLPFNWKFQHVLCDIQLDWRVVDRASDQVAGSGVAQGRSQVPKLMIDYKEGKIDAGSALAGGDPKEKALRDALAQMKAELAKLTLSVRGPAAGVGNPPHVDQGIEGPKITFMPSIEAPMKGLGTILLVDANRLILSVTSAGGFATGDKLNVFEKVRKTNQAGVEIEYHNLIGEIILASVGTKNSQAFIESGVKYAEGWIVADQKVSLD